MTPDTWFLWSGGRVGGTFASMADALRHCQVCANDHRAKRELTQVNPGAYRYVGPRGRRHGSRLVAFLCTPAGAEGLGLDVGALRACDRRMP